MYTHLFFQDDCVFFEYKVNPHPHPPILSCGVKNLCQTTYMYGTLLSSACHFIIFNLFTCVYLVGHKKTGIKLMSPCR